MAINPLPESKPCSVVSISLLFQTLQIPTEEQETKRKNNRARLRGEIIVVLQNQTLSEKVSTSFSDDVSTQLLYLSSGKGCLSEVL